MHQTANVCVTLSKQKTHSFTFSFLDLYFYFGNIFKTEIFVTNHQMTLLFVLPSLPSSLAAIKSDWNYALLSLLSLIIISPFNMRSTTGINSWSTLSLYTYYPMATWLMTQRHNDLSTFSITLKRDILFGYLFFQLVKILCLRPFPTMKHCNKQLYCCCFLASCQEE